MGFTSRGFRGQHFGRPGADEAERVPPGQHLARGFPVLTAGVTQRIDTERWSFEIRGGSREPSWTWDELRALPAEDIVVDIHCVTHWTKLDTAWTGVSLDVLLAEAGEIPEHALAVSYGGYATNLPVAEITGGKAWLVYAYDGEPLTAEHGGPVRMLVPGHYLWKSAKWIHGLWLSDADRPGFWEQSGYHNFGDPWKEERYSGQ
ncbi:molybdopterin-dependent oxidoreductase [Actinomadura parmotrematis]|uniref:Molybdopterin-dependent oxidoreductase n=1 Tax=Actinomadura parmotrematis TaxID=2864039 RepID=A0ABS7FY82_9ACTN|nr:molybdopterin-dependent oxidoreductase [Actinomadura parmotrematis]MBW8485399.1 molybdopterin-dependent oxidoreductase [Actinomadura parmotrematis]